MDPKVIAGLVALVILVAAARAWREHARRTVYVAPAHTVLVSPDEQVDLAERRNALFRQQEEAAYYRGEEDSELFAARIRALQRVPSDTHSGGPESPWDR